MVYFLMYKINKIYNMNLENVAIIFNLDNLELVNYTLVYSYCTILKFEIIFITTDIYNENNYEKVVNILKKSGISLTHDIYFRKRDGNIDKYKNKVSKNIISKGFIIPLIIEYDIVYYITKNDTKNNIKNDTNSLLGCKIIDIIEEETDSEIKIDNENKKNIENIFDSISLTVIVNDENKKSQNLENSNIFLDHYINDSISSSKQLQYFVNSEFKKDLIQEEDIIVTDEIIGTGTFAKVYLGLIKKTKEKIAVKKIKIEDNEKLINLSKEEIIIMSKLNHPNILSYLGIFQNSKYLYIYTEYINTGSISSLIKKHGAFKDENIIKKFVKEILNGIVYLHENRIIHRDIKCSNVLINKEIIKLADFGCTFCFDDPNTYKNSILSGTVPWMAPEMIKKEKFGNKVDIWSLGCTIVEMLNGERPWVECPNVARIFYMVTIELEKPVIKNEKFLSKELKNFINDCLQHDQKIRSSAKNLQLHPFLD